VNFAEGGRGCTLPAPVQREIRREGKEAYAVARKETPQEDAQEEASQDAKEDSLAEATAR
jgi:hypothetical protein